MKTLLKMIMAFVIISIHLPGNTQNLITDGSFTTTTAISPLGTPGIPLNSWWSWSTDASLSADLTGGVCHFSFAEGGTYVNDVQLIQFGFTLMPGHYYRLSFDVKADEERDFAVFIGENEGNWTNFNPNYFQHATTNWETKTIDVYAFAYFPSQKLSFEMGSKPVGMSFDNISVVETGPFQKVNIPGTFQSELGCSGDWLPDCPNTQLNYDPSTNLYTGTFTIPAGCHFYKIAVNGSWDNNYGEGGALYGADIPLYVPQEGPVTFTFNPYYGLVTTSPYPSGFSTSCMPLVVLAGNFQTAVGCANDWDASCTNTALTYNSSTGLFEGDFVIPKGCYEYKVVHNNNWVNSWGQYGQPNGANYILSVPVSSANVHFTYDPVSHYVQSLYNFNKCLPEKVVLAGTFQDEAGCTADWQADCSNTEMQLNTESGMYEASFFVPKGCYEYRVAVNSQLEGSYGAWGLPGGDPNYLLSVPEEKGAMVHFFFNPNYNQASSEYNAYVCQPNTVVIAGSFQNEIGCANDWMPDCDNSRMEYDPVSRGWVDTLEIPAGNWLYKITLNNSWDENYGLNGIRDGENIPLDLCYDAKVVFHFFYYGYYNYVYTEVITNGICLNKFYDANVNGYPDGGEQPMAGITFTLEGNGITRVQTTDNNGKAAFTGLPSGEYWIKESVPAGYLSVYGDSQYVYVYNGLANVNFGNVCVGPGPGGAQGKGFWTSKNGEAALKDAGQMENALWELRNLNLRNADGSDFDPYTYEQFRTWLKSANAKNMAYMVSAQLATLQLNQSMGYIDPYNSYFYTGTCGTLFSKFMNTAGLISWMNVYLLLVPNAIGNDGLRISLECLKDIAESTINNLNFVQPEPCDKHSITSVKQATKIPAEDVKEEAKIWPNPSNNFFMLRPGNSISQDKITINIFDVGGRKVYTNAGSANKDYRLGDSFTPGLYFVELLKDGKRSTFKIVKQ